MVFLRVTQTYHGSSAAAYDGDRLWAANEERFDRIKFSSGFPHKAIAWCLSQAGVDIRDVEAVGFYFTSSNYLHSAPSNQGFNWRYYPEVLYGVPSELLKVGGFSHGRDIRYIEQTIDFFGSEKLRIYFLDHHLMHAAAACLVSPFESSAIVCMDAHGDGTSMSYGVARGNDLRLDHRQPFPHSLGHFYSAFTQFLGFSPNSDEYKVMGMAAHGDAERYYDIVRRMVRLTASGTFEIVPEYFSYYTLSARTRFSRKLADAVSLEPNGETQRVPEEYCDLAAAVQRVTEETILHVLKHVRQVTGEEDLSYCGGVALNCLANGRVLPESGFRRTYIPPNPGDGGLAIGTAAYLCHAIHGENRRYVYKGDYLGAAYSYGHMRSVLDEYGIRYTEPADLANAITERLVSGKVVGHFDGAEEFGPRALGNRSILADPRSERMKHVVNEKVKFRERFRPFAPSCLSECAAEIFEMAPGHEAPTAPENFMLATATVCDGWRRNLQATTHEDGSARIHTVRAECNQKYHAIIDAFRRATDVPVLLNTAYSAEVER